ncbi:unnamed protein product [Protopolystoma xenopodis]|uniref:Uncharacterized protein n=1 Tax=Protopolystoma xenopodis TaxID=117903 RepID=A0A3S5AUG4_9PLAT|nr:unnamed protein product [Protopolystoma xenopodis]
MLPSIGRAINSAVAGLSTTVLEPTTGICSSSLPRNLIETSDSVSFGSLFVPDSKAAGHHANSMGSGVSTSPKDTNSATKSRTPSECGNNRQLLKPGWSTVVEARLVAALVLLRITVTYLPDRYLMHLLQVTQINSSFFILILCITVLHSYYSLLNFFLILLEDLVSPNSLHK